MWSVDLEICEDVKNSDKTSEMLDSVRPSIIIYVIYNASFS